MGDIIIKKDNDKKYVFTCSICGTIFTERERNIEKQELDFGYIGRSDIQNRYVTNCPNCKIRSVYSELEEYDKNKDYE